MPFKLNKQYRLPEFDYSSNNAYYITVCTKDRTHFFGEILNGEMYYTEIGLFATELLELVNSKIEHLKISTFVVMPNHVHFLAIIRKQNHLEIKPEKGLHPLIPKSISSFTNHFKGKVKRWSNENGCENFDWQSRFHDRIVRNREEFFAIKNYIDNNIRNWDQDLDNEMNPNFKQ